MRISKVYTRTGDFGKTRLAGGQEVWKDSLRVETYGTVDELNAIIGLVRVHNAEVHDNEGARQHLEETLKTVQNKLFDVGGILATASGEIFENMPLWRKGMLTNWNMSLMHAKRTLNPLKNSFYLAGGKSQGFFIKRELCVDEGNDYVSP